MPNRKCKNCHKYFYVKKSDIIRGYGKFCNRECQTIFRRNRNLRECKYCGKSFFAFKSQVKNGKKFCSLACTGKYYSGTNSPFWKGGEVLRKCKFCGKYFTVRNFKVENGYGKFCSRECMGHYNSINFSGKKSFNYKLGHPPVQNKCLNCNKFYYIFPSQLGRSKFCSRKCKLVYNHVNLAGKETDIEKIVRAWLEKKYIPFRVQEPILNATVADFFIEPDIAIYCDGEYWHSRPSTKIIDDRVNNLLLSKGYKVIRLKERGIKDGTSEKRLINLISDIKG